MFFKNINEIDCCHSSINKYMNIKKKRLFCGSQLTLNWNIQRGHLFSRRWTVLGGSTNNKHNSNVYDSCKTKINENDIIGKKEFNGFQHNSNINQYPCLWLMVTV